MFVLHSAVKSVTVTLVCCCFAVFALPIKITLGDLEDSNNKALIRADINISNNVTMVNPEEARLRVKRDGSNNKYIDATKMGQLRVLQLFLQGLKNLVVPSSSIGGKHPLHPDSVKPVVALFKYKFVEIFFPNLDDKYMPTDSDAEPSGRISSNRRSNFKGGRYTITSWPPQPESELLDIETNESPPMLSN